MNAMFFRIILVVIFVLFANYNVYSSHKLITLSDLILADVEALASSVANKCCPFGMLLIL